VRTKIPNKVTQRDVDACEQAASKLVADLRACETNIQKLNQDSTKKIDGMVKQYAHVDKQWAGIKKKEGHINKALETQYGRERKYLKVINDATDMMKPQPRNFLQDGGHNAFDPIIVDKWLQCDAKLTGLKQQKEGCKVKTRGVTSWSRQRLRQYTDKADVYINRVASQNEPLDAKIDELKRTSATVSRLKVQSKAVFDTAAKTDFSDFYKIPDDEPGHRPLAGCTSGCSKAGGKVTWTQTKRVGASVMLHFEKFARVNFLRLTNKGGPGNLKSIRLTFSDRTSAVVTVKSDGQLQKTPLPNKVTKAVKLEVLSVHKYAKDVPCEISFSYEGAAGTAIFAALADRKVYKQRLKRMTPSSGWTLAASGNVVGIATAGDTLYGVGVDQKIYKQTISDMTPSTSWVSAGQGHVTSIAIFGNTFYGVGNDNKIYSQVLNTMTPSQNWQLADKGPVISIAMSGSTVYGVGKDKTIYKQDLKDMPKGLWTAIGAGPMTSITIRGDTIYGTSADKKVHQQSLSKMSPSSKWSLAGGGSVVSLALKTVCSAGTYFHKSECLYVCPSGFYSHRGSEDKPGSCRQCTSDCGLCTGAGATCTQCTNSKFLHNGKCVICPAGYFGSGSGPTAVCKKCEANCKTCSDAATCLVCSASVSPFLHNGDCVSACPNRYFGGGSVSTGRSCQKCENGCNKCTDSTTCTQCTFSKYLHNANCMIQCPSEYVGSGTGVTGRICEARLTPGCTVVSGPCKSSGACCESPNHPSNYADNEKCEMRLASITSVPAFNTEAKYDILTVGGKQYSGVAKPSTGTLSGDGLVQWTSDSSQGAAGWKLCGTVKAPSCSAPRYLHNGNKCVAKCPSGFYGQSGSGGQPGSCKQCEANCGACIDATTCTQCTNSKFLHTGSCGTCPAGFFGSGSGPTGRSCNKCEANCKKCSDATTCLVCSNSAAPFLLNGNCISACPMGYFSAGKAATGRSCQACESGCSRCSDAATCTQCTNTMHLHKNNCMKTCPSGHFGSGSGVTGRMCEACESDCNACSTAFICTQCTNSKHLHAFDCMTRCPGGFSPSGTGVTGRTCKIAIVRPIVSNCDEEDEDCQREEDGSHDFRGKRKGRRAQLGDEEEEFLQRHIAFRDSR